MEIIAFFGPLIYFLLANASMVYLLKKSFGKCLPLTLIASAFTLYIGQILFGTFCVGIMINFLFAISSIAIYIREKLKKKDLTEWKKSYITKGFVAFVTIYIMVFVFDINKKFILWDDFMHWGVMLKEMLRLDKFYSVAESTLLMHKDYPPIISIFELFFVKISGGYLEAIAIRAVHLFEISLFIPAIAELKFNKKKTLKTILVSIVLALTVYQMLLFWGNHERTGLVNTIYVDYLIGILFAYILFSIITEKDITSNFSLLNIGLSSALLLLTKQITIVFYVFILFGIAYKLFVKYKNEIKDNNEKFHKILKTIVIIVIIPISLWIGWNNYISKLNFKTDFIEEAQFESSKIKLEELPGIIQGTGRQAYQQETVKNFMNALVDKNIAPYYINLNFVVSVILGFIILFIVCLLGKKYLDKKQTIWLFLTLIVGAIGYVFAILISYVFVFWKEEAPILASYDRYMSTYVISIFSIIIMLGFWLISKSSFKRENFKIAIPTVILIGLIIILIPKNYANFTMKYEYDKVLQDANYIASKTNELDTIYVVSENGTYETLYKIKYYANPRTINKKYSSWNAWYEGEDDYRLETYVKKFKYLYLESVNEDFIKRYGDMFDEVKEKRLYNIIKQDYGIRFTIMEE